MNNINTKHMEEELRVLKSLRQMYPPVATPAEISQDCGLSYRVTLRVLHRLKSMGSARSVGNAKGTWYYASSRISDIGDIPF